jgi:hypothetical protein
MAKAKDPMKQYRPCPGCGLGTKLQGRFQYQSSYADKHLRLLDWKPGDPYLRDDLCSPCRVNGSDAQLISLRSGYYSVPRLFTEEEMRASTSVQVDDLGDL